MKKQKRGKAAPSSKWSGASFFRAPHTQCCLQIRFRYLVWVKSSFWNTQLTNRTRSQKSFEHDVSTTLLQSLLQASTSGRLQQSRWNIVLENPFWHRLVSWEFLERKYILKYSMIVLAGSLVPSSKHTQTPVLLFLRWSFGVVCPA